MHGAPGEGQRGTTRTANQPSQSHDGLPGGHQAPHTVLYPMNRIYAYLRASTKEQDANRGKKVLEDFSQNVSDHMLCAIIDREEDTPQ